MGTYSSCQVLWVGFTPKVNNIFFSFQTLKCHTNQLHLFCMTYYSTAANSLVINSFAAV
jgi:hypothetical protein